MRPFRVVHMSSVHSWKDPRILLKQCASLAQAGWEVHLVVANGPGGTVDGVRIHVVPGAAGRLGRMTRTAFRVWRRALALDADIYHLHDPELVPWGLLLRARGRRVVYDVHEDYVTGIAQAPYLPRPVARLAGRLYGALERLAAPAFDIVIAEAYYARRFPRGVPVLNHPRLDAFRDAAFDGREAPAGGVRLLYTGNVTEGRGALLHAAALAALPDAHLHFAGRCPAALAERIIRAAGGPERVSFDGIDAYVPFERMLDTYRQPWTAALALFPDSPHYREKELTKLFEYMAAGLPLLCSDFPVWRRLVEGVGLTVDPTDPAAIAAAVARLHGDPALYRSLARNGRHAAFERFDWAIQADRLAGLYRRMLRMDPPGLMPVLGSTASSTKGQDAP
ncbi:glycosyltransferase [Azospirillum sp.]|uniref:glycosyltransferase n=1 Tax=Azospirillum sp. TaxID=34012 RepID=UPI002D55FEEC|nr:glycosyltransferase [Azospirillum sp.]HYD64542.1 glycosyltransferase [Azospirillum sp.]